MGANAKMDLFKFQNEREKLRKRAREQAAAAGATGRMAGLKFEMFDAQAGKCLYCGQDFHYTSLDDYRLEHIVPRAQNGPDAVVNYVLAHEKCNNDKGDHTPYQWLHASDGWDAYVKRVTACAVNLRNKKVQLLDATTGGGTRATLHRLGGDGVDFTPRSNNGGAVVRIGGMATMKVVLSESSWLQGGLLRACAAAKAKQLADRPPLDCPDLDGWEERLKKPLRRSTSRDGCDGNQFLDRSGHETRRRSIFRFPPAIHINVRGFFEKRLAEGDTPPDRTRARSDGRGFTAGAAFWASVHR